jgi:hypothetical protein
MAIVKEQEFTEAIDNSDADQQLRMQMNACVAAPRHRYLPIYDRAFVCVA